MSLRAWLWDVFGPPRPHLAPLACGCRRIPGQPVATCAKCYAVTCSNHVRHTGHECPLCAGCGYRHGLPVHPIPTTTVRRRSW